MQQVLRFPRSVSTLQWALGFSVLLHAALLTVRFVDPEGLQHLFRSSSLEIVLVNAFSDEKPPEKPQAIAQATLAGGGEAPEEGRMAATPLPATGQESEGDSLIEEHQRSLDALIEQQEEILAAVRRQVAALPIPDPERLAEGDPEALAQQERLQAMLNTLGLIEKRIEEENSRPRKRYLSPATLGTTYAEYYDAMRRAIEARGTERFPEVGGRKLYGELVMALLVNHDGSVLEARVERSSGDRQLDRMAETIVASAGPFGPFTPAMRKDTDQFDVTALFKFTRQGTLETTLQADEVTEMREQLLGSSHGESAEGAAAPAAAPAPAPAP